MFEKVTGSLAYRLPYFYRHLVKFKTRPKIERKVFPAATIVMMTGKNYLTMSSMSLLSMIKAWDSLPRLVVMGDGTISVPEIKNKISFWPGELLIEDWGVTAAYHSGKKRNALLEYADHHPFGKKLAVILRYAEQSPVVWIDSDVLFFDNFTPFIPQKRDGWACGGSEDFEAAYHHQVLRLLGSNFHDQYKFNAGVLYVSGEGIYEQFDLEQVLAKIHPDYDFCTEQSIFAQIASGSLGVLWSGNVIRNFNADNQQIKAMPVDKIIARHYTSNVRHLFWRDAFFHI
ncbi:hypothetical protein SNE25_20240 [Mucilaginibacter sabulilitoris]|uniref:Nucleotide-diphospho-sugar transferase domain-containing protein n=1 Tax=Mucilaginibacter sabulilitoris TaxID=1173583 RepID=A0ABZ0TFR2_9SPHI|nr:hypothetical protein [Mucilaginibacter sabulilitoris]WPU91651.1 hypothetical protein SNE25_20240 [Mucilaginibacter sabulilitoris]